MRLFWQISQKHLVLQTSDLIADNGDKQYGTCEDYVTILSCDQYRKYRKLIPNYSKPVWTLTPWREQECTCESVTECIKIYGLGVDCDYEIISVEQVAK